MYKVRNFIFLILFIMQAICVEAQVVNKVVAVVNDEVITQQDVDQLLSVLYAQYVQEYKDDELLAKMEEVKKDLLRQMIEDKLILSRAKELNIKVTEEDVDERLERIKNAFPSEEDFYNTLETQGITIANLKDRYRDQVMMRKIVNFEVKSKISVLPSETSEYYEKNRSEFRQDERYKVGHILIKAGDEVGFELAKVEIQNIYNKLKEGRDFGELAKEYSQGPNKDRGGDMGYIEQGEMLEELDNAIVTLKPGEFSVPVKSQIGYHILKVEDIRHGGFLSLDDVQRDIKKMLFQRKLKEGLREWLDELRSKAYISIK